MTCEPTMICWARYRSLSCHRQRSQGGLHHKHRAEPVHQGCLVMNAREVVALRPNVIQIRLLQQGAIRRRARVWPTCRLSSFRGSARVPVTGCELDGPASPVPTPTGICRHVQQLPGPHPESRGARDETGLRTWPTPQQPVPRPVRL
jgi:hypothetical protein